MMKGPQGLGGPNAGAPPPIPLPLLPPQGLVVATLLLPQRGGECSGVALLPGELLVIGLWFKKGHLERVAGEREYGVGGETRASWLKICLPGV